MIRLTQLKKGKTDPDSGSLHQAIQQCRQGEIDALEVLYREYQDLVYRLCYRMARDEGEAADWTQEVFLRVYDRVQSYDGKSKFSTWLYRVTVNFCLDQLKRASRRERPLEAVHSASVYPADPEEVLVRKEKNRLVWKLVEELSLELKTVLILKELEGLSYSEISRILGIPEGTVGSRLNQARKQLAAKLKKVRAVG